MANAGSIVNDANAAGTTIVESTVSGDGSSAVTLTNAGVLTVGNATHPGKFSSDGGLFTTDGSGNIAATSLTTKTTSLPFEVNGNTVLTAGQTNVLGSTKLGAISSFTIASTTAGSHTYNHNFVGTPAFIWIVSSTEPPSYTITSWNATTVTINFTNAGQAYAGIAIG